MLSHLPQELIELIFDDLDVKSLRACTLLSSSLVAPSQRLIFRSLVIRIPHPDFPVSVAEALFTVASHIPRYVRDLTVHLSPEAESFVPQSNLLASILPSFHHLECLSIKGPLRTFELRLGWDDMTLSLQSAIHNLATSTNLWSLDLHGFIDVPPSFIILALSSYTKIGLRRIKVDPSESHVSDHPVTLRTEQITLRDVQGIPELILPDTCTRGYLENVKRLAVGMDPSTDVESRRFIAATASTLHHLELRCRRFETSLDLPRLPLLRVLELHIYLRFSAGLPLNLYSTVEALPETVPAIEVLRLTFYGHLPLSDGSANDPVGPLPWFNDATYREKLPCLRRVDCRGQPYRPPQDHVRFSAYMHDKFLGLSGTGVLEVFVGSDEGYVL